MGAGNRRGLLVDSSEALLPGDGRQARPSDVDVEEPAAVPPTAPPRDFMPRLAFRATGKSVSGFTMQITELLRIVHERRGVRKVSRYRAERLLQWGFLRVRTGSVLKAGHVLVKLVVLFLLAATVAFGTYVTVGARKPALQPTNETTASIVSDSLRTLVGVCLGLYFQKMLDYWWKMRHDVLQDLFNTIADMGLRAAVYFPSSSDADVEARETVLRLGLLSICLLFKDAQEIDAWSAEDFQVTYSLDDLVEDGLLTLLERDLLEAQAARSQVVWVWIASYWQRWTLSGRLPDPARNSNDMIEQCERARNAIGTLLAQLNNQFPLSYTHLVILISQVVLVATALECGVLTGLALHMPGFEGYGRVVPRLILLFILPIVYEGLLDIKQHVANPFMNDETDFSVKLFQARLANEVISFYRAAQSPPYTDAEDPEPARLPPQLIERQITSAFFRHSRRD